LSRHTIAQTVIFNDQEEGTGLISRCRQTGE
jgi:hypothetical protein